MAEIDPLDRLAQLARQEEPPGCDVRAAAMSRIRAAGKPRPAAGGIRWKRPATILAASAAAAALAIAFLMAGKVERAGSGQGAAEGLAKDGMRLPAPAATRSASASASDAAPALDILGSLESEINQMMGSTAPQNGTTAKT